VSLATTFANSVAAAFCGIWVTSFEHEDATTTIKEVCREKGWRLMEWDLTNGLRMGEGAEGGAVANNNAVAALQTLSQLKGKYEEPVVLLMRNLHWQLAPQGRITNHTFAQQLQICIEEGGEHGLFVVGLTTDGSSIPVDLEKHFMVLDHELPDEDDRWELFESVAEDGELPDRESDEGKQIIHNSAGLTRMECLGAASMGVAKYRKISPDPIWDLKVQAIKKTGFLRVYRGRGGFDNVVGVDALTTFMKQSLQSENATDDVRAKGVLLVGPPGSGKTLTAKECGNEIGVPTIRMDVGGMKGSLVGETEGNMRRALKIVDAMAPCILVVDEVEKALAGAESNHDSGVSAGILESLLDWMNEHTSSVYVVMTSNRCEHLPPELSRAGRLDALFFVDIPQDPDVRAKIWDMYCDRFKVEADQDRPKDDNWSPAEIEQCCKMAKLLSVSLVDASNYVVPTAVTYAQRITATKEWAHQRCLSAHTPGIFSKSGDLKPMAKSGRSRRRVVRSGGKKEK
jgi:hypothetical protein